MKLVGNVSLRLGATRVRLHGQEILRQNLEERTKSDGRYSRG